MKTDRETIRNMSVYDLLVQDDSTRSFHQVDRFMLAAELNNINSPVLYKTEDMEYWRHADYTQVSVPVSEDGNLTALGRSVYQTHINSSSDIPVKFIPSSIYRNEYGEYLGIGYQEASEWSHVFMTASRVFGNASPIPVWFSEFEKGIGESYELAEVVPMAGNVPLVEVLEVMAAELHVKSYHVSDWAQIRGMMKDCRVKVVEMMTPEQR